MKGKIFIAWSGTTEIAKEVENQLNKENYMAIVGGDGTVRPDSMFVGQSIINQMNRCSQSIFIISRKNATEETPGVISNNLFFELGYTVARLSNSKIFLFYIDIDENDPLIPSDLQGVWAQHLKRNGKSPSALAAEIVGHFLKVQRRTIPEEKMDIVLKWYHYKQHIQNYVDNPMHSNFEMAQYILFYIQAVFFFSDYHESLYLLEVLKDNSAKFSYELGCAIDCATLILRFYQRIETEKLDGGSFDRLIDGLESSLSKAKEMKDSEFKTWYETFHYENMGFAYYLYISNESVPIEQRLDMIDDMFCACSEALKRCLHLANTNDTETNLAGVGGTVSTNYYFAVLYMSYIYRQIAVASQIAQHNGFEIPDEYREMCAESTMKSFEMRRILFERYDTAHVTQLIKQNFEMEYYLSMAETIAHGKNSDAKDTRRKYRMLKGYIEKVKQRNLLNRELIEKIGKAIKGGEQ